MRHVSGVRIRHRHLERRLLLHRDLQQKVNEQREVKKRASNSWILYLRYNLKFSASTAPSEVDKAENDREADMESVESQEDDEENEEFVEAMEDMADLNASQRKELMEILRKVEKSEDHNVTETDGSTREENQPNKKEGLNGDVIEANISS